MRLIRARTLLLLAVFGAAVAGAVTAGVLAYHAYYVGEFGVVVPGMLYRSRQPRGWQWSVLDRHGIRSVINLRADYEATEDLREERHRIDEAGLRLVRIPISAELPSYEQFEQFIREVRAGPRPTLVHCEHGRNRTGFMSAAYLVVMEGWTVERAMSDMERYGGRPRGEKRRRLIEMLSDMRDHRDEWRARTDPGAPTATAPATQPDA
ncbi:MAG TPA: tyrosine-protein phosphatase [Phycisphaerae bacterium]|nr:tyrosine-protein phosphatase [Phycisphaerae bacterium]